MCYCPADNFNTWIPRVTKVLLMTQQLQVPRKRSTERCGDP